MAILFCMLSMLAMAAAQDLDGGPGTAAKSVGQCYQDGGFAFVSLYCGVGRVIQIQKAFHGAHINNALRYCGELANDCTQDAIHVYDWTPCEGRPSCVRMLQAQRMPNGKECTDSHMLYLQVHYSCIEASQLSTSTPHPSTVTKMDTTALVADDWHSICTNYSNTDEREVEVASPGYPHFYPSDTECRCTIKAPQKAKVKVTYTDLGLLMRASQCVDWLLLQSLGIKNSAAVTCGQMASGQEKTLTAKGNWLLLHFHTAKTKEKGDKRMKGFHVKVNSEPTGKLDVQCYRTSSAVLASLQYKNSKQDASDNILLPQSDLNAIAKPSTAKNGGGGRTPMEGGAVLPLIIILTITMRF